MFKYCFSFILHFDIQRKRKKYNVLIKNSLFKISHSYSFVLEHIFNGAGCSFSVPFLFLNSKNGAFNIANA